MKDASMSLGIYFEIKDAELYGGEGTTGYAATIVEISIEGLQNADFEKYADYSKATAQASEMSQKYEQPAMAVRRAAGLYTCPLCGKRTQVGHTHCHWCGKKLSWDREAYADRDYPHMSSKGGRRR